MPMFIRRSTHTNTLTRFLFGPRLSRKSLTCCLLNRNVNLNVVSGNSVCCNTRNATARVKRVSISIGNGPYSYNGVKYLRHCYSTGTVRRQLGRRPDVIPKYRTVARTRTYATLFTGTTTKSGTTVSLASRITQCVKCNTIGVVGTFGPARVMLNSVVSRTKRPLLSRIGGIIQRHAVPRIKRSAGVALSGLPASTAIDNTTTITVAGFLRRPSVFFSIT